MSRASLRRGHQARKQLQENAMQGLDVFCQPADVRLKAHYALMGADCSLLLLCCCVSRLVFSVFSFGFGHPGFHPFKGWEFSRFPCFSIALVARARKKK
jgi:hypothetical protein